MSVKVTKLNDCYMIEDALEKSKCNFSVEQAEIINSANGSIIGDKKVLYRGDTGLNLGVVGRNYGILQNSEAFAFFDIIAQTQKAKITKVLQYNDGKKILLSAETDKLAFEPRKGDVINLEYRMMQSFDGTTPARVQFYANRLYCLNGLTKRDKIANTISIRHTKNILSRIEEAIKIMNLSEMWIEEFKNISKRLTEKIIDTQKVEKFLKELFGEKSNRKKEIVIDLFENGKGNGKGTAWDLYNGVTEYVDHYSRYTKNILDDEKTLEYSTIGFGSVLKEKAMDLVLEM